MVMATHTVEDVGNTMKITLILIFVIFALMPEMNSVEAKTVATLPSIITNSEQTTLGRKRFRKKRGFMWGLFKKRNPCGCPSH